MEEGNQPVNSPAPAVPAAVPPPPPPGCSSHTKHIAISALIGFIAGAGILLAAIHFSGRRIVKKTPETQV